METENEHKISNQIHNRHTRAFRHGHIEVGKGSYTDIYNVDLLMDCRRCWDNDIIIKTSFNQSQTLH